MLRGHVGAGLLNSVAVIGVINAEENLPFSDSSPTLKGRIHPNNLTIDFSSDIYLCDRSNCPGPVHGNSTGADYRGIRDRERCPGSKRPNFRLRLQPDHKVGNT